MQLARRRDTLRLGRAIAALLRPGELVVLTGDLGTGKTFLARAIARGLGLPPGERVTSPTFTLVSEHETPRGTLLHVDLYRLREERDPEGEVRQLGLGERRAEGAIVVAEWAEGLLAPLGGDPALTVHLSHAGDHGRTADLGGPRAGELG